MEPPPRAARVPARIVGRDADGAPTDHGIGYLRRDRRRTFPDVRTAARLGHEFDAITTALAACRHTPWQAIPDAAPRRRWSGWPHTPGAGPTLMSLYCWATHHTDTTAYAVVRPQLLDQHTVASLIHLGWTEDPVAARFTWTRYTRYCHLLHTWATQAGVNAELIEMWLSTRWRDRTSLTPTTHA